MTRSWFGGWAELADICCRRERERRQLQSQRQRDRLNDPWTQLRPSPPQRQQAVYQPASAAYSPVNWYQTGTSASSVITDWNQTLQRQMAVYDWNQTFRPQMAVYDTNRWIELHTVTTYTATALESYGGWYNAGTPLYLGTGVGVQMNDAPWVSNAPQTEEQRAEHRRQVHLDDLAAQRAKALLFEHLSKEQRREYEEKQYFHVIGQGGRLYRIKHGSAGNVYRIGNDGQVDAKFCIHARDTVPHEDNMLAQMLLLSYDEEQFLAIANRHY